MGRRVLGAAAGPLAPDAGAQPRRARAAGRRPLRRARLTAFSPLGPGAAAGVALALAPARAAARRRMRFHTSGAMFWRLALALTGLLGGPPWAGMGTMGAAAELAAPATPAHAQYQCITVCAAHRLQSGFVAAASAPYEALWPGVDTALDTASPALGARIPNPIQTSSCGTLPALEVT